MDDELAFHQAPPPPAPLTFPTPENQNYDPNFEYDAPRYCDLENATSEYFENDSSWFDREHFEHEHSEPSIAVNLLQQLETEELDEMAQFATGMMDELNLSSDQYATCFCQSYVFKGKYGSGIF